jgi:AcrR family transcriptional regulator
VRFIVGPPAGPSLAQQAVQRSAAAQLAQRAEESAALMAAGAAVMTRLGTERRASVAEIVAEAGLSNQVFYRHFPTKDDLVAAIVDAGARRLAALAARRMAGLQPVEAVRAWITAVLSQATDPKAAAPTRAINWNRTILASEAMAMAQQADTIIWALLEDPLSALGFAQPRQEAYLIGLTTFGVLTDALWADPPPRARDLAFVSDFILRRLPGYEG